MRSIIIDCGSDTCKAGFAGQHTPVSVVNVSQSSQEEIIRRVFDTELKIDPSQHGVLLTEDLTSTKESRELMTQLIPAVLSLYSSGRTNGLVVETGHNSSHVVPIWNGYAIPHNNAKLEVAGSHFTSWMESLDKEYARHIKENMCYVSQDYENELESITEISYTLPNGALVTIGHERITFPEILFRPEMNGFSAPGLDKAVHESIAKCDEKIRECLYSNIVVSGGNSMFTGLESRLSKEIKKLSQFEHVDVVVPQNATYASWIGGSILASLPLFEKMVITTEDYKEAGPGIVHRKCQHNQ